MEFWKMCGGKILQWEGIIVTNMYGNLVTTPYNAAPAKHAFIIGETTDLVMKDHCGMIGGVYTYVYYFGSLSKSLNIQTEPPFVPKTDIKTGGNETSPSWPDSTEISDGHALNIKAIYTGKVGGLGGGKYLVLKHPE